MKKWFNWLVGVAILVFLMAAVSGAGFFVYRYFYPAVQDESVSDKNTNTEKAPGKTHQNIDDSVPDNTSLSSMQVRVGNDVVTLVPGLTQASRYWEWDKVQKWYVDTQTGKKFITYPGVQEPKLHTVGPGKVTVEWFLPFEHFALTHPKEADVLRAQAPAGLQLVRDNEQLVMAKLNHTR